MRVQVSEDGVGIAGHGWYMQESLEWAPARQIQTRGVGPTGNDADQTVAYQQRPTGISETRADLIELNPLGIAVVDAAGVAGSNAVFADLVTKSWSDTDLVDGDVVVAAGNFRIGSKFDHGIIVTRIGGHDGAGVAYLPRIS